MLGLKSARANLEIGKKRVVRAKEVVRSPNKRGKTVGSSVYFLFKRFQRFHDPGEFRCILEYYDSHIPVVPFPCRNPVLNRHKPGSFLDARDRSEPTRKDRTSLYVSQLALADPARP
jgi:hypothetical protein